MAMWEKLHSLFIFSSKANRIFFFKTILVFLFVLFLCFVWLPRRDLESYSGALVDKMERLKTVQGPKIVLIGDSNVTFGMRSDLLEQAFGMPVVNMGYYGGVGAAFNEDMAKVNVVPGDIYILCHMYYNDEVAEPHVMQDVIPTLYLSSDTWDIFFKRPWDEKDWSLLGEIGEAYPAYIKSHAEATVVKIIKIVAGSIGLSLPQKVSAYERTAFDQYGDVAPGRRPATILESDESFREQVAQVPGPETIDRWNEQNRWFAAHGATILLAGYPIPCGKYTPPVQEFLAARKEIETKVEIPLISNFTDYMFGYDLFYDGNGHLTDEGAILRTEQLIKDLQGWMEQTGYRAA